LSGCAAKVGAAIPTEPATSTAALAHASNRPEFFLSCVLRMAGSRSARAVLGGSVSCDPPARTLM
jgi:hypothetical protein